MQRLGKAQCMQCLASCSAEVSFDRSGPKLEVRAFFLLIMMGFFRWKWISTIISPLAGW